MKKIGIDEFLQLAKSFPIIDVRSPGEYCHAHIPGGYNIPLFSDEERKIVGTIYKHQGREDAIKIGLDFFGVKMKNIVIEGEKISENHNSLTSGSKESGEISGKTLLVHCWRGGMRSAGVAWLLDLYGFNVYALNGGYKAYRNWVLQQFERSFSFKMLGGYTGSGKTGVLKELAKSGLPVIDLEGMAHHKGSAFGALGEYPQPTQEMFENELAAKLYEVSEGATHAEIWLEDESRRIGSVNIPGALWASMRVAPLYFLDVPFEERLDYIVVQYGKFEKQDLLNAITRIQKRLGGQGAKDAMRYLNEGDVRECFRILLCYYDKFYSKDIENREQAEEPGMSLTSVFAMKKIICTTVDAVGNSRPLKD